MSDMASNTIRDLLRNFVDAPTWSASRQVVIEHQAELLTDAADADFAAWIADQTIANETESTQMLVWYRGLLQHCRTADINTTFDHLPESRPLNKALDAYLAATDPKEFLQLVQDFPEIVTEAASKAIQEAIVQVQAIDQEMATKLRTRFTLLQMAKAALRPATDDLTALVSDWIETDSWDQSKAILIANAEHLLTKEAIGMLDGELLKSLGEDEERAKILLRHKTILEKARTVSIDAAYAELLKPSPLAQALQRLPDELGEAIRAMMTANSSTELRKQVLQHPILLTPRATQAIDELLNELRQAAQENVASYIEERYTALKEVVALVKDPTNEVVQALIQVDTPSELEQTIDQHPILLDDEALNSLAELITQHEQDGNLVFSQVLRLRLDEIRRIQLQRSQISSRIQPRLPVQDESGWIEMHAEDGGIAINQMYGDIYQVENYTPPTKQWQPPRRPSLRKTFVGRKAELQTLLEYLSAGENVAIIGHEMATTLQGMGGIGKTYLALKLAVELQQYFPGGVIRLDLGPLVISEETAQPLLRRLAGYAFGGMPPIGRLHPEQVAAWLEEMAPGRLLVIFDDIWHQVPLRFLDQALPANAVRILTTRYANVAQALEGKTVTLDRLTPEDGLALLENRLGCEGDTIYRGELEKLVALLDGHALALDIAAGLIKTPSRISVVLKSMQKGNGKDILSDLKLLPSKERDENLEKSLSLSYEWMTPEQQSRFRMLGVFAAEATITPEAAAAVWGMDDLDAVQNALFELADLAVITETGESGSISYRQHSLLRIYAYALLEKGNELTRTCWAHAQYYKEMAVHTTTTTPVNYSLLDSHSQNLLVALQWSIDNEPIMFLELLKAIANFLLMRGYLAELEEYLPKAVTVAIAIGRKTSQAFLLDILGDLHIQLGNIDQACTHYETSLSLYHGINDIEGEAGVLGDLGDLEFRRGNVDRAHTYYEAALPLCHSQGNSGVEANLLKSLGDLESQLGNIDQARAHYEAALPFYRSTYSRSGEAYLLRSMGDLERVQYKTDQARIYYEAALPLFRDLGDIRGEASLLERLGRVEALLDNIDQARTYFEAALPLFRAVRYRLGEANLLLSMGSLEMMLQNMDQARTYFEAALIHFRAVQDRLGEAQVFRVLGALEGSLGNLDQTRSYYEAALSLYRADYARIDEARQLEFLGDLEHKMNNTGQTRSYYEAALHLYRSIHDQKGEARALWALGNLEKDLGNLRWACTHYEAALPLYHAIQDQEGEVNALWKLGNLEYRQGKLDQARTYFSSALPFYHTQGKRSREAQVLWLLGEIERQLGNLDQAFNYVNAALPLYQSENDLHGEAQVLWLLGEVEEQLGNLDQAEVHFNAALSLYQAKNNPHGQATVLWSLGELARKQENFDQAHAHYEASLTFYRTLDDRQGEVIVLRDLADLFMINKEWMQATIYYEQASQVLAAELDMHGQAKTLIDLGHARFELGAHEQGMRDIQQAVTLFRSVHDEESALRAEVSLFRMYARVVDPNVDSKYALSLTKKHFDDFIAVKSPHEMFELIQQKPSILTNEWFIVVETFITSQTDEDVKRLLKADLDGLKQVRLMQEELPILLDFAEANWSTRQKMLVDHGNVLLSESIEQSLDFLLKRGGNVNIFESLRLFLRRCRLWGIKPALYFTLRMHLGNDADLPAEYEESVKQIAILISQQQQDHTALAQAIEAMQTFLHSLSADTQSMIRAALLYDLADAISALRKDHPARRLDSLEAYYREALPSYQLANKWVSVAFIQRALGNALSEQGSYEEALEPFQAAIQNLREREHYKDTTAWIFTTYAGALDNLGRIEEALIASTEAIKLLPNVSALFRNRAEILINARQLAEAEEDLARAVELDGNEESSHLWYRRGQLAIGRGNGVLADKILDEISKRDASFDVTLLRAQSAWLQGNITTACSELRRAFDKANQGDRDAMRRQIERLLNEHSNRAGGNEIQEVLKEYE